MRIRAEKTRNGYANLIVACIGDLELRTAAVAFKLYKVARESEDSDDSENKFTSRRTAVCYCGFF
jgi:hypothetical protein